MSAPIIAFQIIVLIFSVIIHEVSHGLTALKLGDNTAKDAGRLTLNPFKHLDLFGSVILPLLLAISGLPIIGWAKPVPYNPYNLAHPKRAAGLIAFAGPLSNIVLAALFAGIIRLGASFFSVPLLILLNVIVLINLLLAFFNLVPIPPLDGSKVLFALLPNSQAIARFEGWFSQYGFFIILFILFTVGFGFIWPLILSVQSLLVGPTAALIF
ncbi:MAG: site-2 protease family protein [Candidatus Harrisonbacteria bacterium]|nr:site-2 protease family protein [Candidatus Harrisonbacteria bacterium]